MPRSTFIARPLLSVPLLSLLACGTLLAVEPGVDIAAPRVAISQVSDGTAFQPANLTVEQGDWVRWRHVGITLTHTTTSGAPCTADGLWNFTLAPGTQVTRQFLEAPGARAYFCTPHCAFGMRGSVTVTTNIALAATQAGGLLTLSWTGGGGLYDVFRSDTPRFTAADTQVFPPTAGDAGTSASDAVQPPVGTVSYYLVMNK